MMNGGGQTQMMEEGLINPSTSQSSPKPKEYVLNRGDNFDFGFTFERSTPIRVLDVNPGEAAEMAGIRPGDAILSVNGINVLAEPFDKVLNLVGQAGDMLRLGVVPNNSFDVDALSTGDMFSSLQSEKQRILSDSSYNLTDAEVAAYQPFSDLTVLLTHPAHLASFTHFVLSNGLSEDELICFMNLEWFIQKPVPEPSDALRIYDSFLSNEAVIHVASLPMEVFLEAENLFESTKTLDLAQIRKCFLKIQGIQREAIAPSLRQFNEILRMGIGHVYGATLLLNLAKEPQEVCGVVEEVLRHHIDTLREGEYMGELAPPEVTDRSELVVETLVLFLKESGVNYVPRRVRGKESPATRRSNKMHVHAGHHFVTNNYSQATNCGHCKQPLAGVMRQGWTCVECGFHVHKATDRTGHRNCHLLLREPCAGGKRAKQKSLFTMGSTKRAKNKSLRDKDRSDDDSPSVSPSRISEDDNEPATTGAKPRRQVSVTSNPTATQVHSHKPVELPDDPGTSEAPVWQQTDIDKKVLKKLDKKELSRQEAVYELIQTEKGYVRHLLILKLVYRQPLLEEGLFSREQVSTMFSTLDQLVEMNGVLCAKLKAVQAEAGNTKPVGHIGDVFLEGFDKIDPNAYAAFCANQTASLNFYQEKLKGYAMFNACIKVSEAHPACNRNTFKDFIVKPMQRLTKYPMLIKNIMDKTDKKDTAELAALEAAIGKAESLLRFVNAAVRESEDRARLKEINDKLERSHLGPDEVALIKDLHVGKREIHFEGPLQLKVQDRVIDIHAILLSDILLLVQIKDDKYILKMGGAKKKNPIIILGYLMVRAVATDAKAFFLINIIRSGGANPGGPQMYEIITHSKKEAKDWITRITKAVDDFKRNNPGWEDVFRIKQMPLEPEPSDSGETSGSPFGREVTSTSDLGPTESENATFEQTETEDPALTNPNSSLVENSDEELDNLPALFEKMREHCEANRKLSEKIDAILHPNEHLSRRTLSQYKRNASRFSRLACRDKGSNRVRNISTEETKEETIDPDDLNKFPPYSLDWYAVEYSHALEENSFLQNQIVNLREQLQKLEQFRRLGSTTSRVSSLQNFSSEVDLDSDSADEGSSAFDEIQSSSHRRSRHSSRRSLPEAPQESFI